MKSVNVVCQKCKTNIIGIVQKKYPRKKNIIGRRLCNECQETHKKLLILRNKSDKQRSINSKRLLENNPMQKPEIRVKVASTLSNKKQNINDYIIPKKDLPKETIEECKLRMTLNNPMYNLKSLEKRTRTVKHKIATGEIIYKRGSQHHLYKGNRPFSFMVRSAIYPTQTKQILKRDNFTCKKCDSKKNLNVHHLYPLRLYIDYIKKKYNITKFMNNIDLFIQEILILHTLRTGITLCNTCHCKYDKHYHMKKT